MEDEPAPAVVAAPVGNGTNGTAAAGTEGSFTGTAAAAAQAEFYATYCTCGATAQGVFQNTSLAPACIKPADSHIFSVMARQWLAGEAFGVFAGKVSAYSDGDQMYLSVFTQDEEVYYAGLAHEPLLQPNVRALRLMTLVYAAAVEGLVAVSVTVESTAGGMLIPGVNLQIIDLRAMSEFEVLLYGLLISLSLVIFLMELRRYTCPENEDEAERPSVWWLIHFVVPVLISIAFYVRKTATGTEIETLLHSLITKRRSPEDMETLFRYANYDFYWIITMIVTLLTFNLLFFRYVLFYKALSIVNSTVGRLALYLLITWILAGVVIGCFAFILYIMFSTISDEYRTPTRALLGAISMAHGSFTHHASLMENYHGSWLALVFVCWVFLTIVFKNLAVAIFVSFGRDLMLRYHSAYHPMWASRADQSTFNPYHVEDRRKM